MHTHTHTHTHTYTHTHTHKVKFSSDTDLDTSVAGKTHTHKNELIHMFYSPAFAKKRIPTACPGCMLQTTSIAVKGTHHTARNN